MNDVITYIEVIATNKLGEPRAIRLPDNERGRELAAYLKSLARREELESVTIDAAAKPKTTKTAAAATADKE